MTCLTFGSHLHKVGDRYMDQKLRDRHVRRAFDLGIRTFDIYEAPYFQWEPMASILKPMRDEIAMGSLMGKDPAAEIEKALRLFETDHVDFCRVCVWTGEDEPVPADALARYDVLVRAKKAGKVRAIGMSAHRPHEFVKIMDLGVEIDFAFIPFNFKQNGLGEWKDILPLFRRRDLGVVAIKPFSKGSMLSRGVVEKLRPDVALGPAPTKGDIAAASIRWLLSKPYITSVSASMYSDEEIEIDVAAAREARGGRRVGVGDRRLIEAVRTAMDEAGPAIYPSGYEWLARWNA
jgi:predicted aldo/keto reductase-like oxidoreductase